LHWAKDHWNTDEPCNETQNSIPKTTIQNKIKTQNQNNRRISKKRIEGPNDVENRLDSDNRKEELRIVDNFCTEGYCGPVNTQTWHSVK